MYICKFIYKHKHIHLLAMVQKRCNTEASKFAAAYIKRVQRALVTAARHQANADAATALAGAAQAHADVARAIADATRC